MTWICPECQRRFGRHNQSHECAPAMSMTDYFSAGPAYERRVHDAVLAHVQPLGAHVEYVSVGVFFKRAYTFAELRPMRNRVRLSILLSRRLQSPRFARSWHGSGSRSAYFIDLYDADDVDAEVLDWLTEAYISSPT